MLAGHQETIDLNSLVITAIIRLPDSLTEAADSMKLALKIVEVCDL